LNDSHVDASLRLDERAISFRDCTHETKENRVSTSRKSGRASLVRARAFARMNNQQQRRFLAERFQLIDAQELVGIFKALYGRPADKGRPRSKDMRRSREEQPSRLVLERLSSIAPSGDAISAVSGVQG